MLPAAALFPQLSLSLSACSPLLLSLCYYSLLVYLLTGMQWNVNSLPC